MNPTLYKTTLLANASVSLWKTLSWKSLSERKTIGSNEENIVKKSCKIIDFAAVLKYSL